MAGVRGGVGVSDLSDNDLLLMIDEEDRQLHLQGVHLSARQFDCVVEVCRRLGHTFSIGVVRDPFVERLQVLTRNFFRPKDGGAPSIFIGLMTHLGFSYQVHVPIIFGSCSVEPFNHTDATEWQLRRIYRVPSEFDVCFKQVCDVWDIGTQLGPLDGKVHLDGRVAELFNLATFHLTAAVATVSQRTASRGAAQSALISSELAIKALHAANGRSDKWIKTHISHDLVKNFSDIRHNLGKDSEMVLNNLEVLPPLVSERYGNIEIEALKIAELVVVAQQILAAVARSFCGYGYRQKFEMTR